MFRILLVARRDYLAYVGAWGFWASLLLLPVLFGVLMFAPVVLARSEPPRALALLADNAGDATLVTKTFDDRARETAREEIAGHLRSVAPDIADEALARFDAAPDRRAAIAGVRAYVQERSPRALTGFPTPAPRYLIIDPPAQDIEGLRPYLTGERSVAVNRAAAPLYGAIRVRRENGAPVVEYWSVNLSHSEPSDIAARAMRLAMRREALAAQGLAATEADRLDTLAPQVAQFDPRPTGGDAAITNRERAPFYASLILSFLLWSVVFSVASMLLNSVVEEKSNKILDTLLTSVTPLEILIGKLIGVAAVSATLLLVWGGVGAFLLTSAVERSGEAWFGQFAAALMDPRLITAFLIGFVAGYLMYGAIFLALGSLCDSLQESQTLLGPVAMVLAVPMMLMAPALDNPNAPLVEAASWVPLFTPFLLLVRAPAGLSWIEIAGMGAVVTMALVLILIFAARIFRAGVVHQLSVSSLFGRRAKA